MAVATSDGLIDMWGPRINWTAFAPDFQALPRNVEYVEREDEFDQVAVDSGKSSSCEVSMDVDDPSSDGNGNKAKTTKLTTTLPSHEEEVTMDTVVDVQTIRPVPVFASDSEDETQVFSFETKVKNLILAKLGKVKQVDKVDD